VRILKLDSRAAQEFNQAFLQVLGAEFEDVDGDLRENGYNEAKRRHDGGEADEEIERVQHRAYREARGEITSSGWDC
jgi:hypothetical protein